MLIGILHANHKRKENAICQQCKEPICVGDLHTLVVLRYGSTQKKVAKARGQTRPRAGLLYRRVHLQCLAVWTLVRFMNRSEARAEHRGGRPAGSGIMLPSEDKLARKRLIRKRAALLRKLLATDDKEECRQLYAKAKAIREQIQGTGVDLCGRMARRKDGTLNKKLEYMMRRKD